MGPDVTGAVAVERTAVWSVSQRVEVLSLAAFGWWIRRQFIAVQHDHFLLGVRGKYNYDLY